MEQNRLVNLYERALAETITDPERIELETLMALPENELIVKRLLDEAFKRPKIFTDFSPEKQQAILETIYQTPEEKELVPGQQRIRLWPRIVAAASVLLFLSIGGYYVFHKQPVEQTAYYKSDIAPGGNKAILTLANGQKISLTDAKNGTIAQQAGIKVNKTKNGQLIYIVSPAPGLVNENGKATETAYNTIETPKGGQYQVVLPDGSKVWLNAASSITYPLVFNKNDRTVKINGEAYFEIVHHATAPFRVETSAQTIEDIGTHFDVNAYKDEPSVNTTLLEGIVKVSTTANNFVTLKPGQQAVTTYNTNAIKVGNADLDETVAWKNAMFRFSQEKLGTIMREVARWYDVDVTFEDETLKDKTFGAVTTRFANASQLLHKLELTGVAKFRIEGKKIIVMDTN